MLSNKEKQLNLLGLATRAGLLVSGEETVLAEVKKGRTTLVLVAGGASPATQKKVLDKCQHYQVPALVFATTIEISQAIGKKRSICAFIDKGFANSFQKLAD